MITKNKVSANIKIYSAIEVANLLIQSYQSDLIRNQTRLQKIIFQIHAWTLTITNYPLILETIVACDSGPSYSSISNAINNRKLSSLLLEDHDGNFPIAILDSDHKSIVDKVWNKYSTFDNLELARMLQSYGSPWSQAYWERGRNAGLSNNQIKEYYTKLAFAGRAEKDSDKENFCNVFVR